MLMNIFHSLDSYLHFIALSTAVPLLFVGCEFEELEPDFNGKLFIDSNPQMAEIYIDGNFTNRFTPDNISLPPGEHSVNLKHDGFLESDTTIKIVSMQTTKVFMNLISIVDLMEIDLQAVQENNRLYFYYKFNVDVILEYIGVIHPTVNYGNYEEYHELFNDELIYSDSLYRVPRNSYFPGFSGTYTFLFKGRLNGELFEKEKIYLID